MTSTWVALPARDLAVWTKLRLRRQQRLAMVLAQQEQRAVMDEAEAELDESDGSGEYGYVY